MDESTNQRPEKRRGQGFYVIYVTGERPLHVTKPHGVGRWSSKCTNQRRDQSEEGGGGGFYITRDSASCRTPPPAPACDQGAPLGPLLVTAFAPPPRVRGVAVGPAPRARSNLNKGVTRCFSPQMLPASPAGLLQLCGSIRSAPPNILVINSALLSIPAM